MTSTIDLQLNRFRASRSKVAIIEPLICLQGGGLKGGWQAGVVAALIRSRTISPVAAYGTSAGAINAVLISARTNDRKNDVFRHFWTSLFPGAVFRTLRDHYNLICRNSRRAIISILGGYNSLPRLPGLLPFGVFRNLIGDLLPRDLKARIHTYIEVTKLAGDLPPSVIPYKGPSLWLHKGDTEFEVCFSIQSDSLSIETAIAASCCIPGVVKPPTVGGVPVADGGLYTNLPIERLPEHGALGGDCIVVVISRPLNSHSPAHSDIDFRTISSLTDIARIQRDELARHCRMPKGKFNSLVHYPIFLIQPQHKPRLGRIGGLLSRSSMNHDFDDGYAVGTAFVQALDAFDRGELSAVYKFHLLNIQLPALPYKRPSLAWWYRFGNRKWISRIPSSDGGYGTTK